MLKGEQLLHLQENGIIFYIGKVNNRKLYENTHVII